MIKNQTFNDEFLNGKRLLGDPAADQFIQYAFENNVRKLKLQEWLSGDGEISELDLLFPGFALIEDAKKMPDWADPKLMQEGATFFAKHSQNTMILLGLLSLPYCYTAANGAMVLYLSEQIRKNTTKRLYDTAVFVWEVMGPDAFTQNGNGFKSILKVRLIHAAARFYTLKSNKWDNSWGFPINQEDMAGTNLSFSLIVIRGLRKLGFSVSNNEQMAFLHLWKVVGYFTGLDGELIPENGKMATQLDISIKRRQFMASSQGQELTQSLVDHILALNNGKVSNNDVLGLMRHLLGVEISNMLAIKAPDLPKYKLSLIITSNFFKGIMPSGDGRLNYKSAYNAFKNQSVDFTKNNKIAS